ncbi:hypothetical protein A7M79_01205 [Acinetobacter baumannii]|uniref:hypothetical protein n=1 Tax=Acinetobacter baumannii TaxID=470 RepID=UPI0008DD1CD3|nr:hypothetical protein [Acinetobacter baumannii]OIH12133.1 hypothetical protein A7M79_01205 [Acinetobacter baumannii]
MTNTNHECNSYQPNEDIPKFVVIAFLAAVIVMVMLAYFARYIHMPKAKQERLIEYEIGNIIQNKESEIISLEMNKSVEVLNRIGGYTDMSRIERIEASDLIESCFIELKGDQVEDDSIIDPNVKDKLKICVDNYLSKKQLNEQDVLFVLSDERILSNLNYKPLAESFKLFKKQEAPTYIMAYNIYGLLDKAYDAKFDKEISSKKSKDIDE